MTLDEQIQAAVNRALAALDGSAEYELREAQTDLLEFYADNMQSATASNYVRSKSGRLRSKRNTTDKLYVLYGNLTRALQPKRPGNIGEFVKEGQKRYAKLGIDLAVIPYAAIHEFGGSTGRAQMPARPYFYPAIKAYSETRFKERIAKIIDSAVVAWNG